MKQYIFLIAMLFAAVGSTRAQRDIPAALIHLKNGTVDTVYMDNFSSKVYGVNNPQDDDYVKIAKITPYYNAYKTNYWTHSYSKPFTGFELIWQKTVDCSAYYYGLVVSKNEITDDVINKTYPLVVNGQEKTNYYSVKQYSGQISLIDEIPNFSQLYLSDSIGITNALYDDYIHCSWEDGISDDPYQYINDKVYGDLTIVGDMTIAPDGATYHVRPFCIEYGKIYYGKEQIVTAPLTYDIAKSNSNANYVTETPSATFFLSYDVSQLKQKYTSLLDEAGDGLFNNATSCVLSNALKYSDELKNISVKSGKYNLPQYSYSMPHEMPYYVCNSIPQSLENVIVSNLQNLTSQNSFTSEMKNLGATQFASFTRGYESCTLDHANYKADYSIVLNGTNRLLSLTRMYDADNNIFLAPSDAAWTDITAKAKPYYNYIPSLSYMDVAGNTTAAASLSNSTGRKTQYVDNATTMPDSISKEQIVKYLAFSDTVPANKALLTGNATDSPYLQTQTGNKLSNVSEILSNCGSLQSAYFGHKRLLNSYCFKPWETYCPTVISNKPYRTLGLRSTATYSTAAIDASTLSDDVFSEIPAFLKKYIINSTDNTIPCVFTDSVNFSSVIAKPEMDFQLKNLLSTKYRIYVVVAPTQLIDNRPSKPLYMRLDLAYTNASGSSTYSRMNVPGAAKVTDNIIVPGDGKFHAVAIDFDCPICYYGLDAFPTLFVSHTQSFTTKARRAAYEQMLRIVGVYAVPMEEVENSNTSTSSAQANN